MTTTEVESRVEEEYCTICHKPKSGHAYRHEFSSGFHPIGLQNAPAVESPKGDLPVAPASPRVIPAGDPVLRMALIRAGIITPQSLDEIEAELRVAGVVYNNPDSLGQPGSR